MSFWEVIFGNGGIIWILIFILFIMTLVIGIPATLISKRLSSSKKVCIIAVIAIILVIRLIIFFH